MMVAAGRNEAGGQPRRRNEKKRQCSDAALRTEDASETGQCPKSCLPHQCGDQRTRFLKATAQDEPEELQEPRCQWEDWAATLDMRHDKAVHPQPLTEEANEEEKHFLHVSHAAAWGSSPNLSVLKHAYRAGRPLFGQHPYLQPLNLSDAASEGESKSRACLAGLSSGLYVCL